MKRRHFEHGQPPKRPYKTAVAVGVDGGGGVGDDDVVVVVAAAAEVLVVAGSADKHCAELLAMGFGDLVDCGLDDDYGVVAVAGDDGEQLP